LKTEMICIECGSGYVGGPTSKYCPTCKRLRREMQRTQSKANEKVKKALEERTAKKKAKSTLSAVVSELEAYNRKHNEKLTYGQAVQKGII